MELVHSTPIQRVDERALAQAVPFTQFDADLSITYASNASAILGKDYWRVDNGFKFYIGDRIFKTWVLVPEGFLTDGASVPRPFWSLIPPWGRYGQAAVVHDYLCETLTVFNNGEAVSITRARADGIFREAMEVAGIGLIRRNIMYWFVRAFSRLMRIQKARQKELKTKLQTLQ